MTANRMAVSELQIRIPIVIKLKPGRLVDCFYRFNLCFFHPLYSAHHCQFNPIGRVSGWPMGKCVPRVKTFYLSVSPCLFDWRLQWRTRCSRWRYHIRGLCAVAVKGGRDGGVRVWRVVTGHVEEDEEAKNVSKEKQPFHMGNRRK